MKLERIFTFIVVISLLMAGCSSTKRSTAKKISSVLDTGLYENQFTGFILVDPIEKDTLYKHNSSKYFTPASNTKIFTLFASLHLLPETIPALKYGTQNDTLYIQGTGDPSFLHPYLKDSTAIDLMRKYETIVWVPALGEDEKYGPGWSWDDYHWYYSPERTTLPVYGNVLSIENGEQLTIVPEYFKDSIVAIDTVMNRDLNRNNFYFDFNQNDTLEIPMIMGKGLIKRILEKELGRKIHVTDSFPMITHEFLYGIPSDTVYKRMMEVSDNFLAEQLLIVASATISDTLSSKKARDFVLENFLADLRQPPRWVDGSGLSRYNLFTPESMVDVLYRLFLQLPEKRLFHFFPTGGVSGTLEQWYPGDPEPYIHAKTGSLGNNHNVSGYLKTKSGKILIFSFMNNHFMEDSTTIKQRMQRIFEYIRDTY